MRTMEVGYQQFTFPENVKARSNEQRETTGNSTEVDSWFFNCPGLRALGTSHYWFRTSIVSSSPFCWDIHDYISYRLRKAGQVGTLIIQDHELDILESMRLQCWP